MTKRTSGLSIPIPKAEKYKRQQHVQTISSRKTRTNSGANDIDFISDPFTLHIRALLIAQACVVNVGGHSVLGIQLFRRSLALLSKTPLFI
jgi:hypothetical protein